MVWLRVRRWVVRPIFWALALAAIAIFFLFSYLRSGHLKRQVVELLESELSRVVGRAVAVGSVEFELLPGSLVVHDLVIPGGRPGEPPFLEAREVAIELDSDALRRDLIDLETVSIRGLKVRVRLDRGGDNLPPFPPQPGGNSRFAVRIGGLYCDDGVLELDDRRLPIDLKARAVLLRLAGIGGTVLQGNVAAQEVETRLPGATPWPSTVSGKIRIQGDRVDILEARVASAYLTARATGSIGWHGGTHGEIFARARTSGAWLDERGWLHGEIAGDVAFDGSLRFARRDLAIAGELDAPAVNLFGFDIAGLGGHVQGDAAKIELAIERGSYRGAPLAGRFTVDFAGEGERGTLELHADRLPVRPLLADLDLPDFRLASTATGDLLFDFPFRDAASGKGNASLALQSATGEAGVPAEGVAALTLGGRAIDLTELELATPASQISGHGSYSLAEKRGRFALHVASTQLDEVAHLQPFAALEPRPLWLPTAGRGELDGDVRLASGRAEADLKLALSEVSAPGLTADRVDGSLSVAPDLVDAIDVAVERGGSRLNVSGRMAIAPAPRGGVVPTTDLEIAFEGWPVEEGERWSDLDLPLSGSGFGRLHLGGTAEETTGELVGYVSPAMLAGVDVEKLDAELDWNVDRLAVTRAELTTAAGALGAAGTMRFADRALDLRLATTNDGLDLAQPPFAALWGEDLGGRLTLAGTVGGTVAHPSGKLHGEVQGLAVLGREIDTEKAGAVAGADAVLADGKLTLDLSLPELFELHGGGAFAPGGAIDLDLALTADRLQRSFELAAGQPLADLESSLAARIAVHSAPGEALRAELTAERLDLKHHGRALALLEPARLRYEGGKLFLDSLYLGERDGPGEVFVGGTIALESAGRLDLNVQASASVDWVEEWSGLDFDGQLELLTRIGGTLSAPEWNGEASLTSGRFIPPRLPHTVDRIEALALLYPGAVVLDSARGEFAGGTVAAFGRIDLPQDGKPLDYRFQASLANASIRYPEGFLLRGGGELTLQSTAEGRQLRGEVDLSRLDYVQDINLSPAQIVQRFLTRTRLQVEETDDVLASTYLNVAVEAPGALRVRNNLARIDGSVNLAVRGTLANPVLFGDVTTVAGGTIEYNGATYTLERGVLTFANPSRIVPLIDFVAVSQIDDYDVTLLVGGTLDHLTTSFSSNPPLPEYDVLALLATGSATGDSTFSGSGSVEGDSALAAESLLYGQASALIGARVGTLFGVDRLRIDPQTAGDSVSATRVSVGKRLSRKVFVTYSVDPSSTAQQILEVEWKVSNELTLVLTQNGDGSYALDTRWGRRF